MTHHPTHFPLDQGDFDLSNIFIGRKQQIDLFEAYFHRWKSSLTQAASDNDVPMQAAPSPHNKIQALIILLYGPQALAKAHCSDTIVTWSY